MNTLSRILSWLFATPRRAIFTILAIVAMIGSANPLATRLMVAKLWNGFWFAYQPLIERLAGLAFALALCFFLVKALASGLTGGGGGKKKK
jgi:hypothetical protein